jgi:hypothetical protein
MYQDPDSDPNPDPDPFVRGMDPRIRIRIHTKMTLIKTTMTGLRYSQRYKEIAPLFFVLQTPSKSFCEIIW